MDRKFVVILQNMKIRGKRNGMRSAFYGKKYSSLLGRIGNRPGEEIPNQSTESQQWGSSPR
jgi:hypothetical protein